MQFEYKFRNVTAVWNDESMLNDIKAEKWNWTNEVAKLQMENQKLRKSKEELVYLKKQIDNKVLQTLLERKGKEQTQERL